MEELLRSSLRSCRGSTGREFRCCYIDHVTLERYRIGVSVQNRKWPILVLSGTSLPVSCSQGLLLHIMRSGFEVATIENPIGGPFDFHINPKRERPAALRTFLEHLKNQGVSRITAVAQSYSSFELIRTLLDHPHELRGFIPHLILVNAPGLDKHNGYFRHLFRFFWSHTIRGVANRPAPGLTARGYSKRDEKEGICIWMAKTLRNSARSLRELKDIVTYKTIEPIARLMDHGFDVNFFLQENDQVVPAKISQRELRGTIPDSHIICVPGGHNDLFFQKWQRPAFVDFINQVRSRPPFPRALGPETT